MANFITTSVSWAGKETFDYLIRPMFVGKSPLDTQGIRVMPNVQDKQLLNYFSPVAKMLKAAAVGFNGSTGSVYSQRTLNVYRMKAEAESDATVFYNTVFAQLLKKGNWNDLSVGEKATMLNNILTELFMTGLASDIFRQFWLSDVNKTGITSGVYNGVADANYNAYEGMWHKLIANASTTPTDWQIKRVAIDDGAVAQVQTVTMSVAASGTGNLNIDGVDYLLTYNASATQSFTDFKALYATALLARGYTLSGTATLIVTANYAGQPMQTITWTGVSGTVACTIAQTTANTPPSALAAGEAHSILTSLWVGAPKELKQIPKNQKAFYVGDLVYENLIAYLESTGWTTAGYSNLMDGIEMLSFRGIPIINIGWDYHLDADFPHAAGTLWAYPHRIIYSAMENLVLGIDGVNEFNSYDFWFNKDLEMNRWRAKLIMGPEYVHNKLMAVAY